MTGRGEEILFVRATPPLAEEAQEEETPQEAVEVERAAEVQEDPFVLPASTAPALLETNSRPKRARGRTLDYKAMHEGKQGKRSKGTQK